MRRNGSPGALKRVLTSAGASLLLMYSIPCGAAAQEVPHQHASAATTVALQPLALKVRQLETALNYLGHPLSLADHEAINAAIADPNEIHAVSQLQAILDQHVLFNVHINAEGRVGWNKLPPVPNWQKEARASS